MSKRDLNGSAPSIPTSLALRENLYYMLHRVCYIVTNDLSVCTTMERHANVGNPSKSLLTAYYMIVHPSSAFPKESTIPPISRDRGPVCFPSRSTTRTPVFSGSIYAERLYLQITISSKDRSRIGRERETAERTFSSSSQQQV